MGLMGSIVGSWRKRGALDEDQDFRGSDEIRDPANAKVLRNKRRKVQVG